MQVMDWDTDYILVVSHDIVGSQMAGPGIRYYHLARTLSHEFKVVLAVPYESQWSPPDVNLRLARYETGNWPSVEGLIRGAKAIILPGLTAGDFPQLRDYSVPIVIDGYNPLLAEWLSVNRSDSAQQDAAWNSWMSQLGQQYLVGDFFICASERQRDWWLGLLEAHGRANPWTFGQDPTLRGLIDIVPYGLPETPPQQTRKLIKGVWRGIKETDRIVLWGGGLWPWLDPLTAIQAIAKIWQQRQDVKLIFPGTRHPNPIVAQMPTHNQAARELADKFGLLDRAVFFGDWVPYDDWPNVLLDSDIAITLHHSDTLEARLAFRSRVLDYIWAGLPIIATNGDATSELVSAHNLGIVVTDRDVQGVADAILQLLEIPRAVFAKRFETARQRLTWERATRPLIEFCRNPRRASDKRALGSRLGNPHYVDERDRLQAENSRLSSLLSAYQQRRVVRWIDRVVRLKERLG